ncbi:hypothetical protein BZG36_05639, partial [Bifiguratus adelaidae]
VLKVETLPVPVPKENQVLIRVKAFGLNRSEMFTRQGHSLRDKFPRILGIEAVGLVEETTSPRCKKGDIVATCMGGMGLDFDGGYAEYTCVPATQLQVIKTELPWEILGTMPEMLQTAYGSVFRALCLARALPDGFDKALELVGTTTLLDSLKCVKVGICCMTGVVGNSWWIDKFVPMEAVPSGVCLTTYSGGPNEFMATPLEERAQQIKAGKMRVNIGKTFHLDQIVEAHQCIKTNQAGEKIVALP